jgi:hypothetical protein
MCLVAGALLAVLSVIARAGAKSPHPRMRVLAIYAASVFLIVVTLTVRNAAHGRPHPLATTILGVHGEGVLGLLGVVVGGLLVFIRTRSRSRSRRGR